MRSMRAYCDIAIEMALHGWNMGGEVITLPRCHAKHLLQTLRAIEREVVRLEMKIAAQPDVASQDQSSYGS